MLLYELQIIELGFIVQIMGYHLASNFYYIALNRQATKKNWVLVGQALYLCNYRDLEFGAKTLITSVIFLDSPQTSETIEDTYLKPIQLFGQEQVHSKNGVLGLQDFSVLEISLFQLKICLKQLKSFNFELNQQKMDGQTLFSRVKLILFDS